MNHLIKFLAMGGYASYVWPAYGSVLMVLFYQWFSTWRNWNNSKKRHE